MEGDAYCNCEHCSHPLKFALEQHNTRAICTACGLETMLRVRSIVTAPSTAPAVHAGQREIPETTAPGIESKLENIGHIFFWSGVLVVIITLGVTAYELVTNQTGNVVIQTMLILGSIGQGVIGQALFQAAAEGIRQLRKIATKP